MDPPCRPAAGAEGLKPPPPERVHHNFAKDRTRGISGAQKQHVFGFNCGHGNLGSELKRRSMAHQGCREVSRFVSSSRRDRCLDVGCSIVGSLFIADRLRIVHSLIGDADEMPELLPVLRL